MEKTNSEVSKSFRPGTLRAALGDMKVNESLSFPPERLQSIKTSASEMGFIMNRKYKVHRNPKMRTLTVTRIR